ncbi:SGNH/GDSL hydrolase family protein [Luteipulveratus mongoliensis]|uniref:Lysophospholipase n=1 Tax=Luteipulveratus mongoliensis TaxID=571913 RepID=A0A0K1JE23_9MICO|nr:SGNH/GDSL hydrolase family protein [Luteipulveratus mongoliensis]AKU14956.1 lysophospholipase [Luteipulveratus mongoliensis]
MPSYTRYVALGDSQTEGLWDGNDETGLRGWADRLSEHLAVANPGMTYANLAVRGLRARQIRETQLDAAIALKPDIATVLAGMNDAMRPSYDADAVTADLEAMFVGLTAAGATVATLTFPDIGRIAPLAKPLRARVEDLNERIRSTAARHGVVVVESTAHDVTTDPRIWSTDRLHASPLGHARIAAAMAHALELPGSDDSWTHPLVPLEPLPRLERAVIEAKWAAGFLGPWLVRRLRGQSSGDGREAKRPQLLPVEVS